ncbi:TPA: DEAD/DEAH box helicase family protein [Klebsiella pneumoniae]|nr:DEAD/DEAH box helicase family protein [Klebsiella pneumoniae]HCM6635141.1 DEAD/DEAH box helicase family protein [Klebsiella pneumoniae]
MQRQQQTTINTVSAICGAGKSHAFINHINNFPFDRNYIYCVPTLALADELSKKIPTALNLTSNNDTIESIGGEIAEAVQEYGARRKNIIITHRGLKILSLIIENSENGEIIRRALEGWILVIDETTEPFISGKVIPQGEIAESVNILNYTTQADVFEKLRDAKTTRKSLTVNDSPAVCELMGEVYIYSTEIQELYYSLLHGGSVEGAFNTDLNLFTQYDYVCLNPVYDIIPAFRQVHCLGASIQDSPFCVVGREVFNWKFRSSPAAFQPPIERQAHANQHLITVISGVSGNPGLTAHGEDECKLFKKVCTAFQEKLGNAGFIYASNHNKPTGNFKKEADRILRNGDRVPFVSSGVNLYAGLLDKREMGTIPAEKRAVYEQGFCHAVWLGVALLSTTAKGQVGRYIESLGGKPEPVIKSIEDFQTCEAAYQMLMRCRARRFDNDKPIYLYVINQYIADYICDRYLPGAKREHLNISHVSESKARRADVDRTIWNLHLDGVKQAEIAETVNVSKSKVEKTIRAFKKAA